VINYVTGTLGAGKSLYAARKMARALLQGKVVATNVRLVPGFERIILRRSPYYRFARASSKRDYERELLRRYAYVPSIEDLLRARVHGKGEGRGVMVLDEAHNEVNNREWESKNQKESLRYLTLARKRGWHVYVISQHKDNTDAAIRRIATTETRLLNWRQLVRVPVLGTQLLPFNFFLAQTFPLNQVSNMISSQKVMGREVFKVGWYGQLYDTFEDFDVSDDGDYQALWLPHPRDEASRDKPTTRPALAGGGGGGLELAPGSESRARFPGSAVGGLELDGLVSGQGLDTPARSTHAAIWAPRGTSGD